MYKDTEETYRNWNMDVFEGKNGWVAECWSRNDAKIRFIIEGKKKQEVRSLAKSHIDGTYPS